MASIRIERVAELLREQLSQLIRENISEGLGIITITDVIVSADLKTAKIYISLVFKDREEEVLKALEKQTPNFQRFLGRKLKMRYTPKIFFEIDHSQGKIDQVEKILKEINHGS